MESAFSAAVSRIMPSTGVLVGYGSGVFSQGGDSGEHRLVDLLALVSDKSAYFDYLRSQGLISKSSRCFARITNPEITYFADVGVDTRERVKLGVIDLHGGLSRLRDWGGSFYIPGRFQKPIKVLHSSDPGRLNSFLAAQEVNHCAALAAALLLLPTDAREYFDLQVVYSSLINLSYQGDIRMGLAENPKKVQNILSGQFDDLQSIYRPYFEKTGIVRANAREFKCRKSPSELWMSLPANFRRKAIQAVDPREALLTTLRSINRRESVYQALVGVGTTGVSKSAQYLFRKVSKRFIC